MANLKLSDVFYDQERQQTDVLLDILSHASHSEWGERYDFADIHSIEDFRRNVPLTDYQDYREAIEKMKDGAQDVLFDGPTEMFLATSGSTGVPKLYPESHLGGKMKNRIMELRLFSKMSLRPGALEEAVAKGYKGLSMANPAEYERTSAGIPVGSASGQTISGSGRKEALVYPVALLKATSLDRETLEYLQAVLAAAEPKVAAIFCNNLAHIEGLLDRINGDLDVICDDMERGDLSVDIDDELRAELLKSFKADPERAKMLREIKSSGRMVGIGNLWPGLTYLSCWTSASVGRVLKSMHHLIPENVLCMDGGYGASEGKINIPFEPNNPYGIPASFAIFFEFHPLDGGEPICLHQVEEGKSYRILLTTYSGLYRYQLHDIITVGPAWNGLPTIVFACKETDALEHDGHKLYAFELYGLVEEFEAEHGTIVRHIELCNADGRTTLVFEPGEASVMARQFADFMRDNLKSRYGIDLDGILQVKDGYRNSLFVRKVTEGKTVNQTKLATFTDRMPVDDMIEAEL